MKVYIKDGTVLKKSVAEVFADLGYSDLKNRKVLVKPNMLRAAQPMECAATDPELVAATVAVLDDMGAKITVGDNPIPQKVNELEVAKRCGFFEASQGHLKSLGQRPRKVRLQNQYVKETYVSSEILDTDLLVSLPKFKTHMLTTLSVAIKNSFGIVPGGLKPYLHYLCPTLNDFCQLLIDIYNVRPPEIIMTDCLNIRDAKAGYFKPNLIIAGDHGFAVDYVCGLIAGVKAANDPVLRLAVNQKLFNPEQVEIVGQYETLKGFSLPFYFPLKNRLAGAGQRSWAKYILRWHRPVLNRKKCTKCLACEEVCPKKAIRNLTINTKQCIRCYCCIEICPSGAMQRR